MLVTRARALAKAADHEPIGDVIARVHDALVAAGHGAATVYAELDVGSSGSAATVDKVLERIPALAVIAPRLPPGAKLRVRLSSWPDREAPIAAPIAALRQVTAGISRTYAFDAVRVCFGPLPPLWSRDGAPPAPADAPSWGRTPAGYLSVVSDSGTSRRRTRVTATLGELAPPPKTRALPPPGDEATALLDAIGAHEDEAISVEAEPAEQAAIDAAAPRAAALIAAALARRGAIAFPHALTSDPPSWPPLQQSLAGAVGDALRAAKYRRPARRDHAARRTAAGNQLGVRVGALARTHEGSAQWILQGPLWRHSVELPFDATLTQLDVRSAATAQTFAENLAASVAFLDRELLPALEALYPPGAAWYARELY